MKKKKKRRRNKNERLFKKQNKNKDARWAGIAQWLKRRNHDWKVADSNPNPCRSGGRIFSRVDFLCWLAFRYPFHPRVTAVARKRSRSFCQKCRWQVTAKHACALRMWLGTALKPFAGIECCTWFYVDFAADVFTGWLIVSKGREVERRLGEREQRGVARLCVCVCVFASVCTQGTWRDRVTYVGSRIISLCIVVIFHV